MSAADLESLFEIHYRRITKLIANITRDPGRAEELAAEVFLRWSNSGIAEPSAAQGWLFRTAVRLALDETRRRNRRARLDRIAHAIGFAPTPEEIYTAAGQRGKVSSVLAALKPRSAELLLLRAEGMTYDELGAALSLNPASVGKLLSRAQQAFRKEYLERYGSQE